MLTARDCVLYKTFVDKYQPYLYPLLGAKVARLHGRMGGRLIDMGTGPGYLAAELAERTRAVIHAVDINPAMHELARAHAARCDVSGLISFDLVDVHELPYPDGFANLVVSYSCFHHWADPVKALAECARVVAPGGRLLVIDTQPSARLALDALRRAIAEPELFRFVEEAVAESVSKDDVIAIARTAGLSSFALTDFEFEEVDLVECLEHIETASAAAAELPEGVSMSWQLLFPEQGGRSAMD